MKRFLLFVLFLTFPYFAVAGTIEFIELGYTTGASAEYTAATGDLVWSGGDASVVMTDTSSYFFNSTVVSSNFDLYDSATSPARARFDLDGSWSVELYDWNVSIDDWSVKITGTLNSGGGFGGRYWEEKTGPGALDGKAWLDIVSVEANIDWLLFWDVTNVSWDDDGVAGLDTDITLDGDKPDLNNYATDDYSSTNGLTMTIFADQGQVVPEPISIVLLAIGGLVLRRRK